MDYSISAPDLLRKSFIGIELLPFMAHTTTRFRVTEKKILTSLKFGSDNAQLFNLAC